MNAVIGLLKLRIAFILCALLFTGCATRTQRIVEHPSPTASDIIRRISENRDRFNDFSASGIIRIRGTEIQSAAFGFTTAYLQPDFLKVAFLGPFGVNLGRIVMKNNEYEVDFGGHYYGEGRLDELHPLRFISSDLSGSDLLQLFLPLTSCNMKLDLIRLTMDETEHRYRLSEFDAQFARHFWVHPDYPVFSEALILNVKGDTVSFRESRRIKQQRGVHLPTEWVVQLGEGEAAITCEVELSKYHIDRGLIPKDFAFSRRIQSEFDSTEVELER